jgi:hypothetical protein
MKLRLLAFSGLIVVLGPLAACSSSDPYQAEMESDIASVEAKVPTRERASVRICETLYSGPGASSYTEALQFATDAMAELTDSDDPKGMFNALAVALVNFGDASLVADEASFQDAAFELASVCTDILSGEYGK